MRRTRKGFGPECCCPVEAGSQNRRQDQTFGGLEVEADMRLYGQAAVASQQQQVYRGKPMDLKCEEQMAVVVLRQVWRLA
jgi:hypothetical protein